MHVALVMMTGNASFSGGVPAVVMERAKYLVANGHRASIVCRAARGLEHPEVRGGISIFPVVGAPRVIEAAFARLQSVSPYFLRRLQNGLEAAHAKNPVDLIDLQDGPAILGVAPFCQEHQLPMTFTLHGSAAMNPGKRPWIGRRLHIAYERRAYRYASRVLAVSAYISRTPGTLGVRRLPVVIVPNTVDCRFFDLRRAADPAARPFRLLSIGRLVPEKRLETTLRALALLPRGAFHLTVAGAGPDRRAMQSLAAALGITEDVLWLGHVHDRDRMARLIEESHALAFPTVYEAFGIALVEAMAAGLMPVVADIPVIREIVPADFCVPPDDPPALAARFAELEKDRGRLVKAECNLRAVAARYRAEVVYPQLLREYQTTIAVTA